MPTTVRFLGVDSVTPGAGDDTASFVINRHILVDCGWASALRLQEHGLTPLDLTHLVITHCHHDHYLGLPGLIFYRWQKGKETAPPLVIIGPRADLELVVERSLEFLQVERFGHRPRLELHPLEPGESYAAEGFRLETAAAVHPVAGLCYVLSDLATGARVAFTGDTAYHEPLIEHVRGADLLIHEASYGAKAMRAAENPYGHAGAPDAAEIARAAGVRRLALIHSSPVVRVQSVRVAREVFAETFWPEPGEEVEVRAASDGTTAPH